MDKYELREHLAQDWNAISTDDLKIWGKDEGANYWRGVQRVEGLSSKA